MSDTPELDMSEILLNRIRGFALVLVTAFLLCGLAWLGATMAELFGAHLQPFRNLCVQGLGAVICVGVFYNFCTILISYFLLAKLGIDLQLQSALLLAQKTASAKPQTQTIPSVGPDGKKSN